MGFPWVGTPTGDLEKGQAFIHPSSASPAHGHPQTENPILAHWFFLLMYQERLRGGGVWPGITQQPGDSKVRCQALSPSPGPLTLKHTWGTTPSPRGHLSSPLSQ